MRNRIPLSRPASVPASFPKIVDLRKLIELRTELEVFAVRHAVPDEGYRAYINKRLAEILEALRQATRRNDYAAFDKADRLLHETIVLGGGTDCLRQAWDLVWRAHADFHRRSLETHWPDLRGLMDEHDYLVKAITSGDVAAAEDGLRTHLEAIWFRIADQRGEFAADGNPLQRATSYLAFHFHRPLRLEKIAREVAFASPGHLSKLFREAHGISFTGYVQNLRLEKAAELLRAASLPISHIARRVGYADFSRFGQHFRRKFGKTPRQWRSATAAQVGRRREI